MPVNRRVRTQPATEKAVLTKSRRRCCLCFGLHADVRVKKGQVAHIDHDRTNSAEDNLAFLSLDHHDEHDSKRSQAKGFTEEEIKHYREELYDWLSAGARVARASKSSGALKLVDVGFVEDGTEKPRVEDHSGYEIWRQIPGGMEMMRAWANDSKPSAGELPLLDIKVRNTGREVAFRTPQALRTVRAIEVLEIIRTPEAQNVLRALAHGAEGARITREARASLARLAHSGLTEK